MVRVHLGPLFLSDIRNTNNHTLYGALAQLGERLLCTQEVSGSIPLGSTKIVL